MAKTLRVETAIGAYSDYYLRLYTEETNISTVNNTSTVTVYLYGYTERASANCSWNGYGTSSYTITINDGSNHSNTLSNQNVDTGYNETGWRASGGKLLHSYSYTVTHTTDGSKSINISASFKYAGGGSSLPAATYKAPASGTTTVALTKINRGATYSSCTGNNITSSSGTLTININRNGTAYYQRLVSKIGSTTIKTQDLGTSSTSGTVTWSSLLTAMPSSTSKTLTVSIEAYSDSSYTTSVVTNTASIPITIDITSVKPAVALNSIGIYGTTSGDLTTLFSGKSKAQATWSTNTTDIKSTITSVSITGTNCSIASGGSATGGTSKSGTAVTATLPSITSSTSTITFKMTVTDSRGATATVSKTATAYKYAYPSLTVNAYRVDSMTSTTENGAGEYVYVAYSSTPGVTTGNNAIKSYTVSPTSVNANPYHASLPSSSTLTVTVTVKDKAGGSTKKTVTVSTALVPFDLYSASDGSAVGAAIGKAAVSNRFDSYIPTWLHERLIATNTGWSLVTAPRYGYAALGFSEPPTIDEYIQAWLKKVCIDHPNFSDCIFIAESMIGSRGIIIAQIYDTGETDSTTGLPQYSGGIYLGYNSTYLYTFGTAGYTYRPVSLTASKLAGLPTTSAGDRWGVIPTTDSSGYTSVGKYIDFYESDTATEHGRLSSWSKNLYTTGRFYQRSGGSTDYGVVDENNIVSVARSKYATLYSGSIGSSNVTLTNGNLYSQIVIYLRPGNDSAYANFVLIPSMLSASSSTTAVYQVTSESNYFTFKAYRSGNNVIIIPNSGSISGNAYFYGVI